MHKKIPAILLAAGILLTQFSVQELIQMPAYAEASENVVADDFVFQLLSSGNEYMLTSYTGEGGDVVIPSEIDGYTVSTIEGGAFSGTDITGVEIPSSVKHVGNGAFSYCKNLKQVDIAEGLLSIERSVFEGCSALESIELPDSVKRIMYYAFGDCTSLSDIVIPETVETIDSYAFNNCSTGQVTILGDSVDIQYNAFGDYSKIRELVICANEGSTAQALAKRMCLKFTTPDGETEIDYNSDPPSCYEINTVIYDAVIEYLDEYYIEKYPEMGLEPLYSSDADHELFTVLAKTIVQEAPDVSKPLALYNWMNDNIGAEGAPYAYPIDVYNYKAADCLGNAFLLCELLRCSDIPAVVAIGYVGDMVDLITEINVSEGKFDGEHWVQHAWVLYKYDGRWQTLDSAMNYAFSEKDDICSWYYICNVDEAAVYSEYYNSEASGHYHLYKDGRYSDNIMVDGMEIGASSYFMGEGITLGSWNGGHTIGQESWEEHPTLKDTKYIKKNGIISVHEIREHNGKIYWLGQNGTAYEISALDPTKTYCGIPVLEIGTEFTARPVLSIDVPEFTYDITYGDIGIKGDCSFVVTNEGENNIDFKFDGGFTGGHLSIYGVDSRPYRLTGLEAFEEDGNIRIEWEPVPGALDYIVKQKIDGYWIDRSVVDNQTTSVTLTKPGNGDNIFAVDVIASGTGMRYSNDLTASVDYQNKPVTPEITATAGDRQVCLAWNAVEGAELYRVFAYNGKRYIRLADTTETSYTATGLKNGSKVGFLVLSQVGGEWSSYTSDDIVYATPTAPAETTKPVVTVTPTAGGALVTWTPVNGAVKYRVFNFTEGVKIRQFGQDTTDTSMEVKGLKGGTEAGIIVLAQLANGKWTSYTDDDIAYVVPDDAVKPYLCANPKENGDVYLIWSSVPTSVRYKIMGREVYADGTYGEWKLLDATRQRCRKTINNLDPDKQYEFLVRGLDSRNKYTPFDASDLVISAPLS